MTHLKHLTADTLLRDHSRELPDENGILRIRDVVLGKKDGHKTV